MLELSGSDVAVFASDVHLDAYDPGTAELFFGQLQAHTRNASHVFLLGDLFDAWIGDDSDNDLAGRLIGLLARLRAEGRHVFVMRGNRDFLLDVAAPNGPATFAARAAATMLDDPYPLLLFGRTALLAHGDTLCTDDLDYLRFRALTRSSAWQQTFLARPVAERAAIARELRAHSERSKASKYTLQMDANPQAVAEALRTARATLLIHGHTHLPACHNFMLDGVAAQRWVLPDWGAAPRRGGLLRANANGLERLGDWPG